MTEPKLDATRPSSARVWNYLLGGKDNFEIDRMVGDQIRASFPAIVVVAQQQRRFLVRAVTFLAAEANEPVCMTHLLRAAGSEYAKLEKPLTESEIGGWA